MSPCSEPVTPSRFQQRSPSGPLDLIFLKAFGSFGAAAKAFRTTRTTLLRWRRHPAQTPRWVLDACAGPVQKNIQEAHAAEFELSILLKQPPRPPRPLSGCTAQYARREKRPW